MRNNCFEASKYSELFWNEWKLNSENTTYNVQFLYKIKGKLDVDRLLKSLKLFVTHTLLLSSSFREKEDGKLYQYFGKHGKEGIEYKDFSTCKKPQDIKKYLNESLNYHFDLTKPPLYKFILIKKKAGEYILAFVLHHIIMDGTYANKFIESVSYYYNNILKINPEKKDNYINLLSGYLNAEKKLEYEKLKENSFCYWPALFKDKPLRVNLLYSRTRKDSVNPAEFILFHLGKSLSRKIKTLSDSKKISVFILMSAAWSYLLHRYSQDQNILLIYPVNIRPEEYSKLPGCFVNSVPLMVSISENDTFMSLVDKLRHQRRQSKQYQQYTFPDLISCLREKKIIESHCMEIFNVAIAETDLRLIPLVLKGVSTECIPTQNLAAAEISLEYFNDLKNIPFQINYRSDLFHKEFIQNIIKNFKVLLNQCISNSDEKLRNFSILTTAEYQKIVYDWNNTESSYPKNKTIHQLFEEQVEKTPDKMAIVFEDKRITYRELNEKANQLAYLIRNIYKEYLGKEFEADNLIGIYIERSMEMIIGILGILKAGRAYVPLGTSEPLDRLKYKIEDSNCKIILTSSVCRKNLAFLSEKNRKIIPIDVYSDKMSKFPVTNPKRVSKSTDLAYVIYTSGSTGQPKGVLIEHKSVCNFIYCYKSLVEAKYDKIVQCISFCFDASWTELALSLFKGYTLFILEKVEKLVSFAKSKNINVAVLPAALLKSLSTTSLFSLNYIFIGGDVIDKEILNKLIAKMRVYNAYGPTESTVCATLHKYKTKDINKNIGKPIDNISVYILDINLNPVPVGVVGELYIGGDGLARGYLNKPELTKERFIANPFASEKDKTNGRNLRLYKTGDIAKWLSDGNIEYIGRNDFQIKIRGFRIELGEIENKLLEHPSIKQAVVIVHGQDENKKLAAYYTLKTVDNTLKTVDNRLQTVDEEELREYLDSKLPDYMVPTYFVKLEKMLLNTSGKIDRKSLPEPTMEVNKSIYVPPKNETEKKLCCIWQEILRIDKVGINDYFFRIGGHSLNAIDLTSRINKEFNIDLSVSWIFANDTIQKQAEDLKTQYKINMDFNDISNSAGGDVRLSENVIPKYKGHTKLFYENPRKILLTGVTGFLGIHLLVELLKQTNSIIYCLIRNSSKEIFIEDKLKESLYKYKLENNITDEQFSRIVLINGDLGKPKIGLSDHDYSFVISSIDSIYHCGAMVNHIYGYGLLKNENTFSVLELIKIAFNYKPKTLHFISSICAVNNIDENGYAIEYPLLEKPLKESTGYVISKWAAEQLIDQAFKRGLHGSVIRPGNIFVNSQTGIMSNREKNFSMLLMRSFIELCKVPDIDGLRFEAIPVDIMAQIIVLISLNKVSDNIFLNLCNPKTLSLDEYIATLEKIANIKITKLPYTQWRKNFDFMSSDNPLYYFKYLVDSNKLDKVNFKFRTTQLEEILRQLKINLDIDYKKLLSSVIIDINK